MEGLASLLQDAEAEGLDSLAAQMCGDSYIQIMGVFLRKGGDGGGMYVGREGGTRWRDGGMGWLGTGRWS